MRKTKLYKATKFIHDKFGVFINPIYLRPKFIYLEIKRNLTKGEEGN